MNVVALVLIAAFFVGLFIYAPADLKRLEHEQLIDELWDDEVDAVPNLTERPVADVPGSGVIDVDGGRSASSGRVRLAAVDDPIGGAA